MPREFRNPIRPHQGPPPTAQTLRRALSLFGPFKWHLTVMVLLVLATSALEQLPVLCIRAIVDEAVVGEGELDEINFYFGAMLGMHLLGALLGVVRGYLNQLIGQGVIVGLRERLHAHLQRMSMRFFTETRAGEILSRVTTDVHGIQEAVTGTFTAMLLNVATLVNALGLMFYLEWRLALALTVVLPLWVYPTLRIGDVMRSLQRSWQQESANMSAHVSETLSVSGSMLVKSFGRQGFEAGRFGQANQALRELTIKRFLAGRWFNTSTQLFGAFSVGLVYFWGARSVVSGEIPSVGVVVAFATLAQRVFTPFRQIARINTTALTSMALFERIFEYLDMPVEVDEKPDARVLARPGGRVRFEGVSFAYRRGGDRALEDISFEARPGTMLALVGPSGAGKSTIGHLMQRFYDPEAGRVLLDDHDLRDLKLSTLADAVGSVAQDTYLFHTTLGDNIRYGHLGASNDEVQKAADMAGLQPLIEALPKGMETIVGERGHRLSGGEKQRVAIARAILKNPPVLILDEATASLDARLEREIREATERLAQGRTTIVIAHRLSTVLSADEICVLEGGRIVERGTHSELLAQDGLYSALYREQMAEEEASGAEQADGEGDNEGDPLATRH
ncbi:MAG: ABC transporter ATP-binding protein/permease [Myxococcales bacterium]|nr:ABC transporter ATP-binding protein/permease [Myxococcales bacterium]